MNIKLCPICKKNNTKEEMCDSCYSKSPYTDGFRNYIKPIKEVQHIVNGKVHLNTEDKCIICQQKAPAVMGYKTGGRW